MAEIPLGKIELREGKPPDPSAVERRVDYGRSLYASGRADGAREEREAVVAHGPAILDRVAFALVARTAELYGDPAPVNPDLSLTRELAAAAMRVFLNDIEAGEHRKEAGHRVLVCPVCGHTCTSSGIGAEYCGPHQQADGSFTPAVPMVEKEAWNG